jgi:hypothetical protein
MHALHTCNFSCLSFAELPIGKNIVQGVSMCYKSFVSASAEKVQT